MLRNEATANRAVAEDESEIFGSHPDDSLEILSKADTSPLSQVPPASMLATGP